MAAMETTYVQKVCAYVTRNERELLVFEGPEHDGFQIPKGTIESGETPREAVFREVAEESGLGALGKPRHLTTDVWTRRQSPPRRYVRHFFHANVREPRDRWNHTVTGAGANAASSTPTRGSNSRRRPSSRWLSTTTWTCSSENRRSGIASSINNTFTSL